jgi:hypothetical protein
MNSFYSYIVYKNINIKLLNGTIFSIEIGDLDDTESIIDKICNIEESYRIRKHRCKIFINMDDRDNKDDNKDDKYYHYDIEDKYNKFTDIDQLEDNDTLYVLCDPPPYPSLIFNNNSYVYIYDIKTVENIYDTIDSLYYENYNYIEINNNNLLSFEFIISCFGNKKQNNKCIEYIKELLENIPFNDSMKISFKTYSNFNSYFFIESFINFLEKSPHLSLKTLDISNIYFNNKVNYFNNKVNRLINLIKDKMTIENLYI